MNTAIKKRKRKSPTIKIPDDMQVGTAHKTNNYGSLEIVTYAKAIDVYVRFLGYSHIVKTTAQCIRSGVVKNVMMPGTKGDFIGLGNYDENSPGRIYYKWKDMFVRSYCKKYHKNSPVYEVCTVTKEWCNFQKFAEWVYTESNYEEGLHLDKDLKIQGNKVYGPDTCLFVTRSVNNALEGRKLGKGKYPTGVSFAKNMNKFEAYCTVGTKKKVGLGYYNTPGEACDVRNAYKTSYIKKLAYEQTCEETKRALLAWDVGYA